MTAEMTGQIKKGDNNEQTKYRRHVLRRGR